MMFSATTVTQTDITDPRGHVRRIVFNPTPVSPSGFTSGPYDATETFAFGTPNQVTVSTVRQPGTNLPISVTDGLGRTTIYAYDALGNLTSITRLSGTPQAVTTTFGYDTTYSNITSVTDPLGHTTQLTYDTKGNLNSIVDPLGNTSRFTHNADGQVATATDPNGNVTQFTYSSGDLITVTDPLQRSANQIFDGAGKVLATIDPFGQRTTREYNALGLVTKITDAAGGITSFTYDKNGNLLTVKDARDNTTTYTYDNMDRLATHQDALLAIATSQYDGNGNLTQFTDRRNKVTTFQYDELDRLVFVGYGTQSGPTYESAVSATYDAGNRLRQLADSVTGTIALDYDGLDRLTSESSPRGTVAYIYDDASRRTSMTVAGQPQVSYGYDNADRPSSITQGSSAVAFTYDAAGRRRTLTLPNGITTTYDYDAASQLTGLTYQLGSTKLGDLSYSYDLAGRQTNTTGSFARTGIPDALNLATYNANNQLTQRDGISFAYDADGNLTNDGSRTYTWNARNQLASIAGAVTASFQYDPLGRRVMKSVGGSSTSFLYDRGNIVQELSGSTPTANRLNAALDEVLTRTDATGTSNYLTDALGSTLALTDAVASLQTQYTYDPFGLTTTLGSSSTNQQQYAGRENDGTGLYFYRGRYYNPTLQRFVSKDPIGIAGGINLYSYVGNDPVNFVDPFGLTPSTGNNGTFIGGVNFPPGMNGAQQAFKQATRGMPRTNFPRPPRPSWPQGPPPEVNPPLEMPDVPWYKSVPAKLLELLDSLGGAAGDVLFMIDPCLTIPALKCGAYAPLPPA